jgi:hypothetical protein
MTRPVVRQMRKENRGCWEPGSNHLMNLTSERRAELRQGSTGLNR